MVDAIKVPTSPYLITMPVPSKALLSKKRKHTSAEETAAELPKLKPIKSKHTARMLELSRKRAEDEEGDCRH